MVHYVKYLYSLLRVQVSIYLLVIQQSNCKYISPLDSQWAHIIYFKKEDASKAVKELNGDMLGAKALTLTPGRFREPSVFHDIAGYITKSWANGINNRNEKEIIAY